jgi:hypothetical protein
MNQDSPTTDRFFTAFYLVFTVLAFSSIEIIANPIRKMVEPAILGTTPIMSGIFIETLRQKKTGQKAVS